MAKQLVVFSLFVAMCFSMTWRVVWAQAPKAVQMKSATSTSIAAEPASAEEAAKVLDLRTFPTMEGATQGGLRTLGICMYSAKGSPQVAYEFQWQQLQKLGFKELPNGYSDPKNYSGKFTNAGYVVAVSSSELTGDPQKIGWSSITLVNDGNVALEKLPVPPGVKPFYPEAYRAAYTTATKPAETAVACRKLLLAAGWEPYGELPPNMHRPDMSTQSFKRNAIKLNATISLTKTLNEGEKTLIQYDTELLSADLPAPADVTGLQYTDPHKQLRFSVPPTQLEATWAYYHQRLPQQGWKATTEKPIADDNSRKQFMVFRNPAKDMLSLDLLLYEKSVEVSLKHQSAAEVAEEDRRAKEAAALAKAKYEAENKPVTVVVPLPANAGKLNKLAVNIFEFPMATGSGAATLRAMREHFIKEGWTEEKGRELDKTSGTLSFTKGFAQLSLSYFDIGFGNVDIKIAGSKNVVLESVVSKDSTVASTPQAPAKKPNAPAIPGIPELPPGVELPDDVKELLKKATQGKTGK
jgi:hypothetical protein